MQEKVLSEFQRIMSRDPNKLLRPEAIVAVATDPDSVLHKYFTWDESKAADAWRIQEARMLINRVQLYIEPLDIKVKAFTSLATDRASGSGYRQLTDVMADPGLKDQMLATALNELKETQSKYQHLEELATLWTTIPEIEAKLDRRKKTTLKVATGAI